VGFPITAVVLAGGRGTRIAELYPDTPKPMVPVCGRPFLYWVTDWLVGQGVTDIVYSTGYRAEQIELWAKDAGRHWDIGLRWTRESTPLGTGGGVLQCLPLCAGHVLVVNGDSLTPVGLSPLIARARNCDGALLGVKMADAARYGTLTLDESGRLLVGQTGTAILYSRNQVRLPAVPAAAVLMEAGRPYVFVQSGGERFARRFVEVAVRDRDLVGLKSGVAPGDRVVTKGAYDIQLASAAKGLPAEGHVH